MSLSDAAESDLLLLLFENTNFGNIGDATGLRGSSTAGSFYIALHTSNPGETGDQTTNEANYTGYARTAVARTSGQWSKSGTSPTQVANVNAVAFAACTGGSNTITHFSIGFASSGASEMIYYGALNSSLAVSNGITPSFAAGALVCTMD